jgi:hypothetical protein
MITGVLKKEVSVILKRAGLAIYLLAAVLLPPQAYAVTPPPGTPVINRVVVNYRDANGNNMDSLTATAENSVGEGPHLEITKLVSSDPVSIYIYH